MSTINYLARKKFVNAFIGTTPLRYREYDAAREQAPVPNMNTVVMPMLAADADDTQEQIWFSRLIDEVYFRLPELRRDMSKYAHNLQTRKKAGKDTTNLDMIYGDVLRHRAQQVRHGILMGADEISADAFRDLVTAPVDDPRVQAWNTIITKAREANGFITHDFGLEMSMNDEARALYKKLERSIGNALTASDCSPEKNFHIVQQAIRILFDENEEDSDANGESEASGDGENQGEGQGEAGEGSGSEGEGEGSEGDKSDGKKGKAEWGRTDRANALHDITENKSFEVPDTRESLKPLPVVVKRGFGKDTHANRVADVIRRSTFKLSHKVSTLLRVFSAARYRGGHKTGKINKRALATIPSGNERVFRKKEQKDVLDTAVTLLVDSSGSMGGSKYSNAVAATTALADVLNNLHIPVSILGFTADYDGRQKCIMYEHALHGRPVSIEALRDSMCDRHVDLNGNADGEALMYAYEQLRHQKQKRKILIVLSDGQPADGTNPRVMLKTVTQDIEKSGRVELYGIGIEDSSVNYFYSNSKVIRDAAQIEETLLSLLKQSIIK